MTSELQEIRNNPETTELDTTLVCPVCQQQLVLSQDQATITCTTGHNFTQQEGQPPNLTWPHELSGNDATYFEQYKEIAKFYDQASQQLFAMHDADEFQSRKGIVDLLELKPGDRVLEISVGTGLNSGYVIDAVGPTGEVVLQDLSPQMMAVAQDKHGHHDQVSFVRSNASYLPFEDESFDAVLHVGGIVTFTEAERAIKEIQRVAKVGAKIVISDEGMGEWNHNTPYGQELRKINGLYEQGGAPMALLPVEIEDVILRYIMGNVFWCLEWRKRDSAPGLYPPEDHPHYEGSS